MIQGRNQQLKAKSAKISESNIFDDPALPNITRDL